MYLAPKEKKRLLSFVLLSLFLQCYVKIIDHITFHYFSLLYITLLSKTDEIPGNDDPRWASRHFEIDTTGSMNSVCALNSKLVLQTGLAQPQSCTENVTDGSRQSLLPHLIPKHKFPVSRELITIIVVTISQLIRHTTCDLHNYHVIITQFSK